MSSKPKNNIDKAYLLLQKLSANGPMLESEAKKIVSSNTMKLMSERGAVLRYLDDNPRYGGKFARPFAYWVKIGSGVYYRKKTNYPSEKLVKESISRLERLGYKIQPPKSI